MKISEIPEVYKSIFKETAKKLNGTERREYIAMITIKLLDGNARKAKRVFGWGRATVKKGMRKLAMGTTRGNKKTEEKIPQLITPIWKLSSALKRKSKLYVKFIKLLKEM